MDESATSSEEGKVAIQGHIGSGDGADYQVEGAGVRLGPIRVIPTGGYEFVCAQLHSVFFLIIRATYSFDFFSAQYLLPSQVLNLLRGKTLLIEAGKKENVHMYLKTLPWYTISRNVPTLQFLQSPLSCRGHIHSTSGNYRA